ncbi:MAG TPA: acetoacetate--CoA ligase [Rhodocyclaceae bacterium]|nr:MAG: acetoacetate--CoA ligase [Betaproteobacteria bacterium CG2_30_68_42]PIV72251.1 MAG: acetoacetate--CoA ligase [Rhodocyclales bacterium CG17_big_fil_post_rev_8_21_14_2_50_68_7]PIX74688.1 MAG: acetoacetate--CoA ligase [Rhodocyclales bacterium CG_4_10_14_3_um_filter_68_10]PJA57861.1 MAG: acetoacetate--CoA ligase [Rhodocyclales bacterium CG_4_9_14_3_um_filter_68_10]HCX32861.1 acetoacetate--CoA ligase [Rhodocyclaceae bacterium]
MNEKPLWRPSRGRIARSQMSAFMRWTNDRFSRADADYDSLWRWSIDSPEQFWRSVWEFCGVIGEPGEEVLADCDAMPGARWFPQARLNYAENLLARRDDADALVFWGEDKVRARVSHADLHAAVAVTAAALRALGIGRGDRIAAYLPNLPATIVIMLAAASIGAVFSSASPDFGVQGVVDRFGQIEPAVLFAADGYYYNGKRIDNLAKIGEIARCMPSLRRTVIVPYVSRGGGALGSIPGGCWLGEFLAAHAAVRELAFERLPFDHPLFILYSSGTTGVPKCIVHGAGGVLLQHLKEHRLHCDLRAGERLFYFTTCGWMMWNWLASGLASGATLLLYDGSPFVGRGSILFDCAQAEGMTHFGTSAKFIDAIAKVGLMPARTHDLSALRAILSTGSPLAPEGFDYVYREVKRDVQLASISGGTDLISCFVLGCPILPVWRGEIQCRGLGMAVEVFDETGRPVRGRKGELVCVKPFPTMPVGFWNDPDGRRYRAAYFEKYPGVWCHGDYIEITRHGGIVIHGRSDATLNPGGVRIGTAEIYRQVERLDEIVESLVIGQQWERDVRVVLFVKLREGRVLDEALIERIRRTIRENATPRHVPAKILQVADIPRTRSGKIVELAVRNVVHGEPVKNIEALANPQALEDFRDRPELQS